MSINRYHHRWRPLDHHHHHHNHRPPSPVVRTSSLSTRVSMAFRSTLETVVAMDALTPVLSSFACIYSEPEELVFFLHMQPFLLPREDVHRKVNARLIIVPRRCRCFSDRRLHLALIVCLLMLNDLFLDLCAIFFSVYFRNWLVNWFGWFSILIKNSLNFWCYCEIEILMYLW